MFEWKHQSDVAGFSGAKSLCLGVGTVTQLLDNLLDTLTGGLGNILLAIEDARHCRHGNASGFGDIDYRKFINIYVGHEQSIYSSKKSSGNDTGIVFMKIT
jgi:hypothetical protein